MFEFFLKKSNIKSSIWLRFDNHAKAVSIVRSVDGSLWLQVVA